MSMPLTQITIGALAATSVAVGSWGISTEVRLRNYEEGLAKTTEVLPHIQEDVAFIRGYIEAAARKQELTIE